MGDLPTDYDVIVIGTGMTGSITAAALSRVGKTVLHIDENDFYGEEWSSFNLEGMTAWLESLPKEISAVDPNIEVIKDGEKIIPVCRRKRVSNVHQEWFCPEKASQEAPREEPPELKEECNSDATCDDVWTKEKLMKNHRKFNLDLSPRMLYSRGALVELLISSNIARYAEFKTVSRVLTWRDGRLEVVPCSRADVFATKHVSVVQKRMLVKILTSFSDYPECKSEFDGFEDKTFVEYLKHKKIDAQLIHYIVYAIAMGSNQTPCLEGVEKCQKFLLSLGRYGNTPFIAPLYGSGELPQSFCRLCAVFGGVYHLKRPIDGFVLNEEGEVVAILSGEQRLNCLQIVVTSSLCPDQFLRSQPKKTFHRGIFITDRSIAEAEKEAVTLLQLPPESSGSTPTTVMEMGGSCQVCPPGLFLVHMTTEASSDSSESQDVFSSATRKLFMEENIREDPRPRILWQLTWQMSADNVEPLEECPKNFKIVPGPDASIDYDGSVAKACQIFKELCPDEEFLPRAPDPDEIVEFPAPTDKEIDSNDIAEKTEEVQETERSEEVENELEQGVS